MSTVTARHSRGAERRIAAAFVAVGAIVLLAGSNAPLPTAAADDDHAPGSALPVSVTPMADAIEAAYGRRSYRPGETATLQISTRPGRYELQISRAGYGSDGPMRGRPVAKPVTESDK